MISKYLKVVCLFNAIPNFNAVRSNDADRFGEADLSACKAPDNVKLKKGNMKNMNLKYCIFE